MDNQSIFMPTQQAQPPVRKRLRGSSLLLNSLCSLDYLSVSGYTKVACIRHSVWGYVSINLARSPATILPAVSAVIPIAVLSFQVQSSSMSNLSLVSPEIAENIAAIALYFFANTLLYLWAIVSTALHPVRSILM